MRPGVVRGVWETHGRERQMSGPLALLLVSIAVPVGGFLVAAIARLVVSTRRPPRLSWPASVLCGIVGAAAGAALAALALDRPVRDAPVAVVLGGLAGPVVLLVVADQIARRRTPPRPGARQLITAGESGAVEFKSSARYNRHTGERDARLELVIASSVAAFFNASGGTLLIGVADDGTVAGIEDDYRLVKNATRDGFELWLRDLLVTTLGTPAAEAVVVEFESIEDRDVVLLRVPPARRPVFVRPPKQRAGEFVVRVGNSSRQFAGPEMLEYAVGRWSTRALGGHKAPKE